jgi:hypothetical protein
VILVVSFLTIAAWHIAVYRIYINQVTTLQKVLTILPFLKFMLSLLIFYYVSITDESDYNKVSLMKVYLDTVITTLLSIFKTIMWFLIIILSWVRFILP